MIKLKNIKMEADGISCVAFVEDCREPIKISVMADTKEMKASELPQGYEWCKKHLNYAKQVLSEMLESGITETSKTVMWY